jgi:SNF2 family DNA or RNA helicase
MLQISFFWRDTSREDGAVEELAGHGLRFSLKDSSFVTRMNAPENDPLTIAYQLLAKNWEVWAEKMQICIVEDFKIRVDQEIDWLEISLQIPGEKPLYGWQLILMLKRRSLFVQLGNGTLGVLPEKWYLQLAKLMNLTDDDRSNPHPLPADGVTLLGLSELLSLETQSPHLDIAPSLLENLDVLQNQAGLDDVELPETFLAELRPYQKIGLAWLMFMQRVRLGACLADDMGLGKSVQVIALFETLRSRHLKTPGTPSPWPALLVVPRTLVSQWLSECQRFAPQLRVRFVKGRDLETSLKDPRSQVIIVTFGAIAGLKPSAPSIDNPTSPDRSTLAVKSLVVDEAQKIKNPQTRSYQGMCQVKADWRLALTGTPLENHWYEFFGLFNLLNPNMRRLAPGQWDHPTSEHLRDLLPIVKPLTLRRLKTEVLRDLPAKREESVFLDMLPKQKLFYDEVKQLCLTMLNTAGTLVDGKSQFQFLEGLLRLRQITCHPDLVFGKNTGLNLEKRVFGNSAKIEFLKILIPNLVLNGRKTVIFSQFAGFLEVIRTMLLGLEISCLLIDGKTHDRQQIVETFQTQPDYPVLLASIRVGGVGLNLTAADTCILMEPWWNPAVESQAVDRINRIGQTKSIEVYRLYCKDSIEEKILLLQQSKDERAKMIQFLTDADVAHLSREDFQRLLD